MEDRRLKEANLRYLAALSHFPKFGPASLKKLKRHFPSLENAFNASLKDLAAARIDEAAAAGFIAVRADIDPDAIMEKLEKEGIKVMLPEHDNFPKLLREIPDRPELLYYKGALLNDERPGLAVVGTRKFTSYGQMAAENIVRGLAGNGLTIVSGLAIGIDTIAHSAALEAGGRTIAVIGSGLDRGSIYPGQNRHLADEIIAGGGAVISEFPLGTPPLKFNFPQRNRIVAGMSLGTLVIEADEKSGALITARLALDYDREVMAVPGNICSRVSTGANNLIKQGAKTVTRAEDVLEALDMDKIDVAAAGKKIIPESPEEAVILDYLGQEARHLNELVRLTKLDISKINSTLAIMEMKGMVRNMGNMTYGKNF